MKQLNHLGVVLVLTGLLFSTAALAGAKEETPKAPPAAKAHPGLLDPSQAAETAPETFRVRVETTAGTNDGPSNPGASDG